MALYWAALEFARMLLIFLLIICAWAKVIVDL